jgi:peptidoglycan/xylan/chitin deacetylase (PgdA/CDA1 family)
MVQLMRTILAGLALSLAVTAPSVAGAAATSSPSAEPKPLIAFTWDDVPAHGAMPADTTRVQIAATILKASAEAGAPAFGFINGVAVNNEPASAPVLKLWREAGQPLGNHTWSHQNLASLTPEQFALEVTRNEPLLETLMGQEDWRWLRYPFLSEGDTPEKRLAVRKWLAGRGYRIASVTMGFGDYAFNDAYVRCKARNDEASIAGLEQKFLEAAGAAADHARAMSQTLFGKDIPYVLLVHAGAFDARMAPRLFKLYQDRGFGFTTLQAAQSDPFYTTDMEPGRAPGPTTLESVFWSRGQQPPSSPVDLKAIESLCR